MRQYRLLSVVASAALIGNLAFADSIKDGDTFDASDWKNSTKVKVVDSTNDSVEMNISATDVDNDTLNINAGDDEKAILDWTKLDVDSDKYLKFGGDDSIYLNKVSGDDASDLLGTIKDDGSSTIIIVNPNGINVGSEANIEVNNLLLSTEDLVKYDGDDIDDNASKLGERIDDESYDFKVDDNLTDIVIENGAEFNVSNLSLLDDGGKIEINSSINVEEFTTNVGYDGDGNWTIASSDVIIDENGTLSVEDYADIEGKSITIKSDINASDAEELYLATTGGDIVTENNATLYVDVISIGDDDLNTTGNVNIQTKTSYIDFGNTKNIYITNDGDLTLHYLYEHENNRGVENNLTINFTNDEASLTLESNLTAGDTISLENVHSLYLKDNEINATTLNISTDREIYFENYSDDGDFEFNEDRLNKFNTKNLNLTTNRSIYFGDDTNLTKFDSVVLKSTYEEDEYEEGYGIRTGDYATIYAKDLTFDAKRIRQWNNIEIDNLNVLNNEYYYLEGDNYIKANKSVSITTNNLNIHGEIKAKNIALDINNSNYDGEDYYYSGGNFIADEMNITSNGSNLIFNNVDVADINLKNINATFNRLSSDENITIFADNSKISIRNSDYNSNTITINNENNLELGDISVGDLVVNADKNLTINGDINANDVKLKADNIDMIEEEDYYYNINNIFVNRLDVNASSITLKNVNVNDSVNVYNGKDGIDIEMTGYNDNINIVDANEATIRGENVDVNFLVDDNITLNSQIDNLSITANHNVNINDLGSYNYENDFVIDEFNNNKNALSIVSDRDIGLNTDINVSSLTIDTTGDLVSAYSIISDDIDINASRIGSVDGGRWVEYYDEEDDDEYYERYEESSSVYLKTNDDAKVVLHSSGGEIAVDVNGSITLDNISFEEPGKLYVNASTINLSQDFNDTDVKLVADDINFNQDIAVNDLSIKTDNNLTIDKKIFSKGDVSLTSYNDIILDANITANTIILNTGANKYYDDYYYYGYRDGKGSIIQKNGVLHSTNKDGVGLVLTSHTIGDKDNHLVYKSDSNGTNRNVIANLGRLDTSSGLYLDSNVTTPNFDANRSNASWIVFNKSENSYLDFNLSFYDNQEDEIDDGVLDFDANELNSIRYDSLFTLNTVNIVRLQEDVTDIKEVIGDGFDSENTISKYIGYIVNGSNSVADINTTDFFENGNNLATNLDLSGIKTNIEDLNSSINSNLTAITSLNQKVEEVNNSVATNKKYVADVENMFKTNIEDLNGSINSNLTAITSLNQKVEEVNNSVATNKKYVADVENMFKTNIEDLNSSINYNSKKLEALADYKVDGSSVTLDDYKNDTSIFNSDDLVIELKEAVDASNAKASETALSDVADTTNTLEEENKEGSLFVDFFKKLFGDS